jgi:DNA-binding transcriptional MocR family regulator
MVSVRNERAAAATRRDWYRADPRAYIRIAAVLRERITAGELLPGQATPSITRLRADHGVARQTAAHALRVLQDAGLVYRSPDSATTSALTSFPGFANRAASLRTVSQAARKRCLPELRYARCYLRGGGCRPERVTS